jgi:hypothetical protein
MSPKELEPWEKVLKERMPGLGPGVVPMGSDVPRARPPGTTAGTKKRRSGGPTTERVGTRTTITREQYYDDAQAGQEPSRPLKLQFERCSNMWHNAPFAEGDSISLEGRCAPCHEYWRTHDRNKERPRALVLKAEQRAFLKYLETPAGQEYRAKQNAEWRRFYDVETEQRAAILESDYDYDYEQDQLDGAGDGWIDDGLTFTPDEPDFECGPTLRPVDDLDLWDDPDVEPLQAHAFKPDAEVSSICESCLEPRERHIP